MEYPINFEEKRKKPSSFLEKKFIFGGLFLALWPYKEKSYKKAVKFEITDERLEKKVFSDHFSVFSV